MFSLPLPLLFLLLQPTPIKNSNGASSTELSHPEYLPSSDTTKAQLKSVPEYKKLFLKKIYAHFFTFPVWESGNVHYTTPREY